jgi:catechol 2,3-dioxygenase-like lactoylglutathione lyase family enzyme
VSKATPQGAIGTIDHVVIAVGDLEASAERYRRLGFTLSPKGVHSAALGTANHTIMLQRDYFELLTVVSPTERNDRWRRAIAASGGIDGIAFTTENAAAAREHWLAQGLAPDALMRFSRAVPRPSGPDLEARFEAVSLPDLPETGVRVFVCSQPTREAVWLPELVTHANTAQGIVAVTIASPDLEDAVRRWREIVPDVRVAPSTRGVDLVAGAHRIELVPASGAGGARALGLAIRVGDLDACRAALDAGGVRYAQAEGAVVVPPDEAANVELRFLKA